MPSKKRNRHRTKPVPLAKQLGKRIKELRLSQGYNFDAIVEASTLSRAFYNEIETGRSLPSLLSLQKIAAALEPITLADLMAVSASKRDELLRLIAQLSDESVVQLTEYLRLLIKRQSGQNTK